jgi:hypothetical protein
MKDFEKNSTEKEPRDFKLEAEIISQKITLSNELMKDFFNKKK